MSSHVDGCLEDSLDTDLRRHIGDLPFSSVSPSLSHGQSITCKQQAYIMLTLSISRAQGVALLCLKWQSELRFG